MIRKASTLFGKRPVHLLEPERTAGPIIDGYELNGQPVRREMLLPICCIGDFTADAVPGADGCASALVVVWFQLDPPPVLIEPELLNIVGDISWNDLAMSY